MPAARGTRLLVSSDLTVAHTSEPFCRPALSPPPPPHPGLTAAVLGTALAGLHGLGHRHLAGLGAGGGRGAGLGLAAHGLRAALTGALKAVHADCAARLSGGRTREPMATAGGAETHGSGPAGLSRGAGAAEAHEGLEAGHGPAPRGSGGVPGKMGRAGPRAVRGGPESCRGPPVPLLPVL